MHYWRVSQNMCVGSPPYCPVGESPPESGQHRVRSWDSCSGHVPQDDGFLPGHSTCIHQASRSALLSFTWHLSCFLCAVLAVGGESDVEVTKGAGWSRGGAQPGKTDKYQLIFDDDQGDEEDVKAIKEVSYQNVVPFPDVGQSA